MQVAKSHPRSQPVSYGSIGFFADLTRNYPLFHHDWSTMRNLHTWLIIRHAASGATDCSTVSFPAELLKLPYWLQKVTKTMKAKLDVVYALFVQTPVLNQ